MRTGRAGLVTTFFLAVLGATASLASAQAPPPQRALLDRYCIGCHSQRARTAGLNSARLLTVDNLDPAKVADHADTWETIVRKLRSGMMPPSGAQRPDPATLESFVSSIEVELDRHAAVNLPPPGLHRLNRTEYANAIRDLLALEIDPAKYLPADDSTRGFDNVAGALSISPALLEAYVSAAAKISRLAMGSATSATETVYKLPEDASQEYHIEGMPFRTRGGIRVEHEFPADGVYGFSLYPINKGNMDLDTAFGDIRGEKLELLVDGERVKLFDWDKEVARGKAVRNGTDLLRVPLKAGRHTVIATFLATQYAPGLDLNQHFMRSTIELGDLPGFVFFPQLGKLVIEGPENPAGASHTASRGKIFVCRPESANADEETKCAQRIVANLARRAYRRPVTAQDTETLMGFYQQGRNQSSFAAGSAAGAGSFDQGIEMALNRILADPEFVFRKEAPPANLKPGDKYRLTDLALASRLSSSCGRAFRTSNC